LFNWVRAASRACCLVVEAALSAPRSVAYAEARLLQAVWSAVTCALLRLLWPLP
jgi:hypothetical protein